MKLQKFVVEIVAEKEVLESQIKKALRSGKFRSWNVDVRRVG